MHPEVKKIYPVLGLGSEGRIPRHFQTPTLYWVVFEFAKREVLEDVPLPLKQGYNLLHVIVPLEGQKHMTDVPLSQKGGKRHIRQNRPFTKPPFRRSPLIWGHQTLLTFSLLISAHFWPFLEFSQRPQYFHRICRRV